MKNTSGFTIVELLIVIVVIAILATITIVSYNGITAQANNSAVKTGLSNAAKKLTVKAETDQSSVCYSNYQEINISCINSSDAFAALPKNSIAKNSSDVMRYYMHENKPTLTAKSITGVYFRVQDGTVKEITEQQYLSTNASDYCSATATYSSQNNSWTQEPHFC